MTTDASSPRRKLATALMRILDAEGQVVRRHRQRVWEVMNGLERLGAALILAATLTGCMTPQQRAALEEESRRQAEACQLRGGWFVSGACISRAGGQ